MLRVYKKAASANSCSHGTPVNEFWCDKPRKKKKRQEAWRDAKCLHLTLSKFHFSPQISTRVFLRGTKEGYSALHFSTSNSNGKMTKYFEKSWKDPALFVVFSLVWKMQGHISKYSHWTFIFIFLKGEAITGFFQQAEKWHQVNVYIECWNVCKVHSSC